MNVLMMYVPGQDDDSRMLRRTLMRYLNLSLILVLRSISKAVKRRFPTKDHLIEAGKCTHCIRTQYNTAFGRPYRIEAG